MGSLVLAYGHERRLGQGDVRGLQDGVGEQAVIDVLGLVLALLLVCRSALEPADGRHGVEHPAQLGHFRPIRLDEDGAALRVQAEGDQRGGHLERLPAQHFGIVNVRQRVEVDDAVDRLVAVLQGDVIADRAQIVAEVGPPGRLDAAVDAWLDRQSRWAS